MASYRALSAVATALIELLHKNCPVALATDSSFALYGPKSFDEPMAQGLSLMLYRVAISGSQRNHPPRRTPDGRRMRPSLPVDLHFLLTAWAGTPELQHLLLGWAMRFLEDRNQLPAGVLNLYDGAGNTFAADEAVELVCDPLALADYLTLWDKLKTRFPVSQTYVVRMVALDSELEMSEGAAVRTRGYAEGVA
jgi:hypothetical protein